MLVFGGGISNSSPNNDLWKYHFHTQTWKKLSGITKANFFPKMYHCILGSGVAFQTTSGSPNTSPSHWKGKQKDRHPLVPIPKHSRLCDYFHRQPLCPASREQSEAIEMKTFSLPLEPAGFRAFQTTSGAELDPNRATSILSKEKPTHLFVSAEKETFAAAVLVEEEERTDCRDTTAVDEVSSDSNVLLVIGGKPLSSFSEISFWQIGFDSLSPLWLQGRRMNSHQRARRCWTNHLQVFCFLVAHWEKKKNEAFLYLLGTDFLPCEQKPPYM